MKKLITIILCIFCFSCVSYADENTYTDLQPTYSSNISPQTGDTFLFTYKNLSSNKTDSFKLDVSKAVDKTAKLNIEPGDYMMMNIEYIGNNEQINKEGFVATTYFSVGPTTVDSIYLGIGQEAGKIIEEERNDTISIRYGLSIPSITDEEQERLTEEIKEYKEEVEKTGTSEILENDSNETTETEDITDEDNEEEVIQKENQEDSKQNVKSNHLSKIILLIVLAVVSIILFFISYKKSKLN